MSRSKKPIPIIKDRRSSLHPLYWLTLAKRRATIERKKRERKRLRLVVDNTRTEQDEHTT